MNAIVVVLNWRDGVWNAIVEVLNVRNGVLNSKVSALNSNVVTLNLIVAVLDLNDGVPILKVATHNSKLRQICSKRGVLISVVEWALPTRLLTHPTNFSARFNRWMIKHTWTFLDSVVFKSCRMCVVPHLVCFILIRWLPNFPCPSILVS